MSSFTSFITDSNANMDRQLPSHKRPASRVNDFEIARRSQRNEMFFTDEDDGDSIFGADDISVIGNNDPRMRQAQPHIQPQSQLVRSSPVCSRAETQGNAVAANRRDHNGNTETPGNYLARQPASLNKTPPTQTPTQAIPQTIAIKDEDDELDIAMASEAQRTIPPSQQVKIFIGRQNRSIIVNRTDLNKSPTLASYVTEDPDQGRFIMRPELMNIHYEDFIAVAQFLRTGEYAPLLQTNPVDREGPKILKNVKDEGYAKELVKAGKIYRLAKTYEVQGMAELIFKKVSGVDPRKYGSESLVRIAEVIFKSGGNGNAGQGGTSQKDPFEEWIVGKLALNFQEIMRTQRERFFEVAKATIQKMLYARVLEEHASKYRASGGKLPEPVIELD